MIDRGANFVRRVIEPVTRIADTIGVVVLGVLVLMLIYSVIMRKAFNAPMKGVFELSEFAMVLITFLFVSAHYFKPDSMVMDTFIEKFPKKIRAINDTIIHFLDFSILAILSWRLFAYAIRVQEMKQVSKILDLPVHAFVYLGAVCTVLLTLVFMMHFLFSLNKAWRA